MNLLIITLFVGFAHHTLTEKWKVPHLDCFWCFSFSAVKKHNEITATEAMGEMAKWLTDQGIRVLVEPSVKKAFPQYDVRTVTAT